MRWVIACFAILYVIFVLSIAMLVMTFDAQSAARDAGRLWRAVSDGFSEGVRR